MLPQVGKKYFLGVSFQVCQYCVELDKDVPLGLIEKSWKFKLNCGLKLEIIWGKKKATNLTQKDDLMLALCPVFPNTSTAYCFALPLSWPIILCLIKEGFAVTFLHFFSFSGTSLSF